MTAEVKEAIAKAQEVAQGMEDAEKTETMNRPEKAETTEKAEKAEKAEKPKKPKAKKTADRAEEKKKAEIAKAQEQKLKAKEQAALERELKKRAGTIDKNLASIETSFLVIAFNLHWIKRNNMHKAAGYKNIYEYAENEHGLGRTTCCNLICIVDNFAKKDPDGNILDEIDDCYKKFKQSQLVAMSGMSPVLIQQIDEKTSVREILRIRKENEIEEGDEEDEKPETEKSGAPIVKTDREILTQFSDYNDYLSNLENVERKLQKALKENNGNVVIQIVCVKKIG